LIEAGAGSRAAPETPALFCPQSLIVAPESADLARDFRLVKRNPRSCGLMSVQAAPGSGYG
jgi:hypothetical protein